MGVRLYVGECYGILLTDEEKKVSYDKVQSLVLPYLQKLMTAFENKEEWMNTEDDHLTIQLWAFSHLNEEMHYDKTAKLEMFLFEKFLTPQQEYGSSRFFGLVGKRHYNDTIDYAFISLIRHLVSVFPSIGINDGYQFEFPIPPADILRNPTKDTIFPQFEMALTTLNEFNISKRKMDHKQKRHLYVPSEQLLFRDEYFTKAFIERGKDKDSYFFDTKEECEEFINTYYKTHDVTGCFFTPAWQLIKLVYPTVTLERVKRYIVGWWA